MKTLAALIRREVLERRLVLAAAALAAVLPFLVPIAQGLHGASAREARETLAALLTAGFALVLATVLGWSALSRDLADRRLGFYFSRPIPGTVLWAGKLLSAWILALAASAVIWLPSLAAGRGTTILADLPRWSAWALLGASAILVILSHAAAVALRSRSALLLLDLAILVLAAAGIGSLARFLVRRAATGPLQIGLAWTAGATLLGLLVGGLVAITRGRGDIRAAHRALSPWLWIGLAAGLAGSGGLTAWVLSSSPRDLALTDADPAPSGKWIAVNGTARGALAGFLLDTESGHFLPAGCARLGPNWWEGPWFSADGSTAAWLEPTGVAEPYELVLAPLTANPVRPRRTGFQAPFLPSDFLASPDGRRVALLQSGQITVVETAAGRILVSARLAETDVPVVGAFFGPDRVLAALRGSNRLELVDLDIPARRLSRLASISGLEGWYNFRVDPSGERVLVREKAGTRLRLFDVRTGEMLALLAQGPRQSSSWQAFLADGRILFLTAGEEPEGPTKTRLRKDPRPEGRVRLRLFAKDGHALREIAGPPASRVLLGGEVAPGKVVFATGNGDLTRSTLYLADLDSGAIRRIAEGLYPVLWFPIWSPAVAPGAEETKLFYSVGEPRSLVRLDPSTGARRVILAGRPRG